MMRAYRYRLYPTDEQRVLITRNIGCCRKVWNLMLESVKNSLDSGRLSITHPAQFKVEYPYLKEADSVALVVVENNLKKALKAFFDNPKMGFPKFKSAKFSRRSYTTRKDARCDNVALRASAVRLPKIGDVRCKVHRRPPACAVIKTATVDVDAAGRYHVVLAVEIPDKPVPPVEHTVDSVIGIDWSSPDFAVAAGFEFDHPKPYRRAQAKLAREQRRLNRMQRGSANYEKQRRRIGRLQARIADIRRDYLHKASTAIAKRVTAACVEDIDMSGMAGSLRFGKSVHDGAFGAFRLLLAYKLAERDGRLVVAERGFASSKLCSACGWKNDGLTLADREWTCPACGAHHNRDLNASANLKAWALKVLGVEDTPWIEPQDLRG